MRISRSWLLLVSLYLVYRPRLRAGRILAKLAPRAPLPKQVPALVERLLGGAQLTALLRAGKLAGRELAPKVMLGLDQLVDATEDFLILHRMISSPQIPSSLHPGPRRPARGSGIQGTVRFAAYFRLYAAIQGADHQRRHGPYRARRAG